MIDQASSTAEIVPVTAFDAVPVHVTAYALARGRCATGNPRASTAEAEPAKEPSDADKSSKNKGKGGAAT